MPSRKRHLETRTYRKWVTPPEASQAAAVFREVASRVEDLARELQRVGESMESTWEGKAKTRFFAEYAQLRGQLNGYLELLARLAGEIENMKVEVEDYRQEWVSD